MLSIGVVLLVFAAAVALAMAWRTPFFTPVSAYEIARLLEDRPVASERPGVTRGTFAAPPTEDANWPAAQMIRGAIARELGRPLADVSFSAKSMAPADTDADEVARFFAGDRIERDYKAYAGEGRFNPDVYDAFTAAVRMPGGGWKYIRRDRGDSLADFRWRLTMLVGLAVLLVVPVAWWFSRRIAEPIRSFAAAADRIGRREQSEPVDVRGPTEIKLAARSLNDMHARLERYVLERTSMIGAIAHDLRTPLARLAFLLAAGPEELRGRAEAEIAEMEAMIAAVLDFVAHEATPRTREPLDLPLLVEGVVDDFADMRAQVTFVSDGPAIVAGDPLSLRRMIRNLVGNAVQYAGSAEVSTAHSGSNVMIEVSDRGPGLTAADLERAFEPFYRGESSRNRTTGGIGLGLAIVRAAASAHGGDVELAARPGGGTTARITLPLQKG